MNRCSQLVFACAVLGALLLSTSCVRFIGPEDVRLELSEQAGVKLRQETGLTVTRSGIWLARQFVDEQEVPLRGLRRVEVGVYEVKGLRRGLDEPRPLDPAYFHDWQPVVRLREDGEEVMVFVREKDDHLRSLLVVVAEPEEWVLVRMHGRLDDLLEQAMRLAFDHMDRPDLYAKTRRERGLDAPRTVATLWTCQDPG